MKRLALLAAVALTGCTSVQYNGSKGSVKNVDYPELGQEVTVQMGESMLKKGVMVEMDVLSVTTPVDGALYAIPSKEYKQVGYDNKNDFFEALGVTKAALADPLQALSVKRGQNKEVCVITVFGGSACYDAQFERKKTLSVYDKSFQQTLQYAGRSGDEIKMSYREFSNDYARPAFNGDVVYDLSESNIIGYKGALIEIINANNTSITYKVIKSFPDE
ncbi:TPA: hypothetical protein AB5D21_003856 [Vibrio cholerae]